MPWPYYDFATLRICPNCFSINPSFLIIVIINVKLLFGILLLLDLMCKVFNVYIKYVYAFPYTCVNVDENKTKINRRFNIH